MIYQRPEHELRPCSADELFPAYTPDRASEYDEPSILLLPFGGAKKSPADTGAVC